MSMAAGRIGCTGCDFDGFLQYRPITVVYCFDDGTEVKAHREFAWCKACDGIRDVEASSPAVEPLETELAESRALTERSNHRIKQWFTGLLGHKDPELEDKIAALEGQIRLTRRKGNRSRCLRCGSEDTHALFDFVHACGGHLRSAPTDPDPDAGGIRFSYGTETICLDEDGRLVD
jgi:hypothetical protein